MKRLLSFCKLNLSVRANFLMWFLLLGISLSTAKGQSLVASASAEEKLSLSLENVSLKDFIEAVEKKTLYKFSYDENEIIHKGDITITVTNEPLVKVLQEIAYATELDFKIVNNLVHISARSSGKQEGGGGHATESIIYGTVTDQFGDPLPGVSIFPDAENFVGTISNKNGEFTILSSAGHEISSLTFSYVGFKKQQVPVVFGAPVNVKLSFSTKALDEVVVIGYGKQKRRDLTGAIATINNNDLNLMPVPSVSNALQGRAAGVQVVSSGIPGADAEFRIRGIGTINDSNPLLVIDGVPVREGLNRLNPNDIESVQILKDASAAAIYGSQGANGVVIITTKRGKGEKSQINFDYFTGIQQSSRITEMLNASQFAVLHNEIMINNGQEQNPAFSDPASLGKGTDWMSELFKPAPMHNYSLSYASNGEKSNVYVSANIFDQEGVIINTGFKRYTVQVNSDNKIYERLKFGNTLTLNHEVKYGGDWNIKNTMAALPTQPIMDAHGNYTGPTAQPMWEGNIQNPIGKANLVEHTTKGYNMMGSIYSEMGLFAGLNLKSSIGLQANISDDRTWAPKYDWKPHPDPHSFLFQRSNKSFTYVWDNTLTYDKHFRKNHHLTILAGTSAQEHKYEWMSAAIKQFASDNVQQLGNGNLLPLVNGNAGDYALLSYIGRVNYVFSEKYLFTATVRHDGSSRFGEGNRWGTYPSFSAAYRISEENFFNKLKAVNDLKIRAGYGLTGNQEIGNYPFASVFQTSAYNFNNHIVPSVVPHVMPNPHVRWEAVEQANVGLDASLFKGKVFMIVDAYVKNTRNMLVPMAVPVSTGYSPIDVPEINSGRMLNKGIELSISSYRKKGAFNWDSDFNISYNLNKILSLNDTIPYLAEGITFGYTLSRNKAGHAVNEFFGFVTDGIFQTSEEVENHAIQVAGNDPYNRTSPGDIRFRNLNNDQVINDSDRTFIGNPNPKFTFGFNNSIGYKNFDLSIFIQGVTGNKIFNANRIWNEAMAVAQNQTTATLDRWTGPGTSNTMPRAVFNDPNNNTRASDRYIEDGSYLRVKNITLGYKLPANITEKAKLNTARVYASAQNLYTLTRYSGLDPEVPFDGIDFNIYPVPRTISVGLSLSF